MHTAQSQHILTYNEDSLPRVSRGMLVTAMPSSRQRLSKACQDVAKVLTQPSEQDGTNLSLLRACVKVLIQRDFGRRCNAATCSAVMRMVLKRCGFQQ